MSAYFSKYYSNSGKKNVFCKTLMSDGIFGRQGKTYAISTETMNNKIKNYENKDIVLEHNDNQQVGKVLEVFCNGSEGLIDRNGGIYDRVGWTAIYELDENKLKEYGLTLEEAGRLDLSTSYYPIFSNKRDLYNGAVIDNEVVDFKVNNVAIVKKGRYNATRGIINNSDEVINLIFSDNNTIGENIDNSMEEKEKIQEAVNNATDEKEKKTDDNNTDANNSSTNAGSENNTPKDSKNDENAVESDKKVSEDDKTNDNNDVPVKQDMEQKGCQQCNGTLNIDLAQLTTGISAITAIVGQLKNFVDVMQGNVAPQQPAQPQEQPVQQPTQQEQQSQEQEQPVQQQEETKENFSDNNNARQQWLKEHEQAKQIMRDNLTPDVFDKLLAYIINDDVNVPLNNGIEKDISIVKKESLDKLDFSNVDMYKFYSF